MRDQDGYELEICPPNKMTLTLSLTVGGMTEIELGVLFDTSGPELFLVVARYKESENERKESFNATLFSRKEEIVPLHWNDVGLDSRTPKDCPRVGMNALNKNVGQKLVSENVQQVNEEMLYEKKSEVNGDDIEVSEFDVFDKKKKIGELELKVSANRREAT